MEDATVFINYIGSHYKEVGGTLKILCAQRKQKFDEDAFHETILRCHKAISKKGYLKDKTAYGIQSYLIRSYFNIILEEKRSAKNAKRDMNYNSDNIGGIYEDYYNSNNVEAKQKVVQDLFKDFSVLFIMMKVEENWDAEHYYLFKVKELVPNMTYKKLAETTKMKAVRQKVVEVKRWVQENITKDEIRKVFYEIYGDLIL